MTSEQLDHKIEAMKAQVQQDETLARLLLANAAQSREMLDVMEEMRKEIQQLKEEKMVVNTTINVGRDYIQEQNINTLPHNKDE